MNIEEKLDNFYEVSIEHARKKCMAELEAYGENLDRLFEEHRQQAERQAKLTRKAEKDEIRRISNMEISREQLRLRHELSAHVEDLETRLFEEAQELIGEFRGTPAYIDWLKKQIEEEISFDPQADLRIYICASDEVYLEELRGMCSRDNVEIMISAEDFGGGSRGVIHSRNILIDNSMKKKIADVRDAYQLREEI